MKCLGPPLDNVIVIQLVLRVLLLGGFYLYLSHTQNKNIFLIVIYFDDDKRISKFPSLVCRISPSKMLSVMMTLGFCYNHGLVKWESYYEYRGKRRSWSSIIPSLHFHLLWYSLIWKPTISIHQVDGWSHNSSQSVSIAKPVWGEIKIGDIGEIGGEDLCCDNLTSRLLTWYCLPQ